MPIAAAMPPSAASNGSTNRRRSRRSPRSNSRRASSPRTRKKNDIRPLFTHSWSESETPVPPSSIASVVSQSSSYEEAWTFTQTSAATAAASSTAAPPVSVRRKFRSGVWTFLDQAVRPENGAPAAVATTSGRSFALVGDEVALLRVPLQIRLDERTHRNDTQTARADVLERARDQTAADPLTLCLRRHLRVHEHDHVVLGAVPELAERVGLAVTNNLVPASLLIVPDDDVVGG